MTGVLWLWPFSLHAFGGCTPQDVMKAGAGQLAAALVQAESSVSAACELVNEAVKLRDERPPTGRGASSHHYA